MDPKLEKPVPKALRDLFFVQMPKPKFYEDLEFKQGDRN